MSAIATTIAPGATTQGTVQLTASATETTNVSLTSSNLSVATAPAFVTVSSGSSTGTFTITGVSAGTTTITASLLGTSKTMQIVVSATPALSSLALSTSTAVGGTTVDATVLLTAAAPAGGALVTLTAEDPAAVPSTLLIPAGATSAPFAITSHTIAAAKSARITSTYAGVSASAVLNVTPASAATANFGVTGTTETETCALINGGSALDCTFNGSTSTAPGTITAWDWTYGVSATRSQTTAGPVFANPAFSCSLLPAAPLPAGASSLAMSVTLVVHDNQGNVSAPAVHKDVRVLPQGACGY